jgi:hypothetical protein
MKAAGWVEDIGNLRKVGSGPGRGLGSFSCDSIVTFRVRVVGLRRRRGGLPGEIVSIGAVPVEWNWKRAPV